MPQIRRSLAVLVVVLGLAGCGAPAVATDPAPVAATPTSAASPSSAVEIPAPGTIALTGDLVEPGEITAEELAALPQQSVDVEFLAGGEPEKRSETGPALSDVLPADSLAVEDGRRNDQLAFAVLAVGSDGYTAAVAYGDVSPDFGNRGLLISLVEDGQPLERPRLIVPGDVRGGRYVSDLVELRVVRLG